jgi:hypothetical protein
MRGLILAAFFLLSACWGGENLYTLSDARVAMPAGKYLAIESGDATGKNVTVGSDGLLMIEGEWAAFAPLDNKGRAFATWFSGKRNDRSHAEDIGVYGLIQRQDNGDYVLFLPKCADTKGIARAAGANVETLAGVDVCTLPTRASLEDGLRRLQSNPGRKSIRFTPMSEGPLGVPEADPSRNSM